MTILSQLSSQRRERSEYHNRKAALRCLDDPDLLDDIAVGLASPNAALAGDCAEVMTMVAQDRPEWVVPYAPALARLLKHKTARERWEAMHALALAAKVAPEIIDPLLPALAVILRGDPSVIARDYAAEALGSYAASGSYAARKAYPLLREALRVFDGKQAHHALHGLALAAALLPEAREELTALAEEFSHSERGVVRKAARALEKALLPG